MAGPAPDSPPAVSIQGRRALVFIGVFAAVVSVGVGTILLSRLLLPWRLCAFHVLATQVRTWLTTNPLTDAAEHKDEVEFAVALNAKPFAVRKLERQARGYSEQRLRRAYAHLARIDEDFKGGSKLAYHAPYIVLQRWVIETCAATEGLAVR